MKNKFKILVTGGAGFIGTNLIKRLLKDGHEVHSLDTYDVGIRENEIDGCNYISGDINHIFLMDKDFDIVYHLASMSRIQPSFKFPMETFRVNVDGTESLLRWAHRTNTKVIFTSSSSIHNGHLNSPYSTSKYIAEQLCKMYRNVYNLDVQIARLYNVYGPNQIEVGTMATIVGKWIHNIKNNLPIEIVGDGYQRRAYTHVDDVVNGLIKLSTTKMKSDAWEFGNSHSVSVLELSEIFKKHHKNVTIKHIPNQQGNYTTSYRKNRDAIGMLGWSADLHIEDYIKNLEI